MLMDLALRGAQEPTDRIVFSGNHISRSFIRPMKDEQETGEAFARRLKEFHDHLPRKSDQSFRLALASEAFVRAGMTKTAAAALVWKELQRAPGRSALLQRRIAARLEMRPDDASSIIREIQFSIGATKRGQRTSRKKRGIEPEDRIVNTVRTEVSRYRREHDDFNYRFEAEFASFLEKLYDYTSCGETEVTRELRSIRDALRQTTWYRGLEDSYRKRLSCLESDRDLGQYDHSTAAATAVLARHLHDQRRWDEAAQLYVLALERWGRATPVTEARRQTAIRLLNEELARCGTRRPLMG